MRRQFRKYTGWAAAFAVLITLGAATAAYTAGAAPFGALQTTTTVPTTTDTTATTTTDTTTTTTTTDTGGGGGGGGAAPPAEPTGAEPAFTG